MILPEHLRVGLGWIEIDVNDSSLGDFRDDATKKIRKKLL